jgi:integrase
VYYRDQGRAVRKGVARERGEAEQVAAQINAQLAAGAPTLLSFQPITVAELRRLFLEHHESVLHSSVATVDRYRTATKHLQGFVDSRPRPPMAHAVRPEEFAAFLRTRGVSPNGHPNTARRRLLDKGVVFVLETCRTLYGFAALRRHLPPYFGNPFAELPLGRLKVTDAKPIFVFDEVVEMAFLRECDPWEFPIHFMLAKTGLRVGELTHLLIEDVDLDGGWLHVRNKPALGWQIKTGTERTIPLVPELSAVLRLAIGARTGGPVFLRRQYASGRRVPLFGDRRFLESVVGERIAQTSASTRSVLAAVARGMWRDAGAIDSDIVRLNFVRVMRRLGRPENTCPKSWRHSFATLLQDANVDPLIRQQVLGHRPSGAGGLGMTAAYTHTRSETLRRQTEAALRLWPCSLSLAVAWVHQPSIGGQPDSFTSNGA